MRLIVPFVWFVVSLPAATIAGTDTSAILHTGDSLAFQILTWNFGYNAARFHLPRNPTDISFTFISAPVDSDVPFSAWLESPDGTTNLPFAGPLHFTQGWFSSSQYIGFVSTLSGYLHLATTESIALFATGSATLRLRNNGPDIAIGLLNNNLQISLTGGPLSVGAIPQSVSLTGGSLKVGAIPQAVSFQTNVPEPRNLLLMAAIACAALSFGHFRVRNRDVNP
jgi:hypothetical protein